MIFFYLLVSVMPLTQHPLWARYVGQMTLVKYVGAVCLLYAAMHLGVRRDFPRYFQTWQARWFATFLLLANVSFWTKGAPFSWGANPLISHTSFLLLFFITLAIVDSVRRLRWTLIVAVGSVAWASLYLIREWQKYHNVYRGFRPGWGFSRGPPPPG